MKPAIDGRRATRDLARLYVSPPGKYADAPVVHDQGVVGGGAGRRSPSPKSSTNRVPNNWRGRLPMPSSWYALNVPELVIHEGVGSAPCPMHADRQRSFTVDLRGSKGVWTCPDCGKGDMVSFVARRFGVGFVDAVRRLVLGGER